MLCGYNKLYYDYMRLSLMFNIHQATHWVHYAFTHVIVKQIQSLIHFPDLYMTCDMVFPIGCFPVAGSMFYIEMLTSTYTLLLWNTLY